MLAAQRKSVSDAHTARFRLDRRSMARRSKQQIAVGDPSRLSVQAIDNAEVKDNVGPGISNPPTLFLFLSSQSPIYSDSLLFNYAAALQY